jgi:hypothetical protein
MSANKEKVLCLRCQSEMEHSDTVYAIPQGGSLNPNEEQINPKKAINIQILRCSNPECDFIELKAPKRWPSSVPRRT